MTSECCKELYELLEKSEWCLKTDCFINSFILIGVMQVMGYEAFDSSKI